MNILHLETLRKHQVQPIDSILNRCDTMVVYPTGSGKSVIFQIPALVMTGKGQRWTLRLDVNLSIKAKDTVNYAVQLMNLNGGVTTCAALYYLYSLIQPLFLEAGWERNYVCLLLGPSQSRKTSLIALLSCIYNRQDTAQLPEAISLLSTPAAILGELGQYSDICRMVDDLYPSTSRAETRRREEKLSDIIRLVGNNASRGRVTGLSSVDSGIPCGVICTAEYLPQGYSTLIRCLLLELEQPLPTRALTALQNSPLVWPTFIFRFLSWCAANYDRLVMHLKKNTAILSKTLRASFHRRTAARDAVHAAANLGILFSICFRQWGLGQLPSTGGSAKQVKE